MNTISFDRKLIAPRGMNCGAVISVHRNNCPKRNNVIKFADQKIEINDHNKRADN